MNKEGGSDLPPSPIKGKKVKSAKRQGEDFFKKLQKQPEKIANILDKVDEIGLDGLLDQVAHGKEDKDLMIESIIQLDSRVKALENEIFGEQKVDPDGEESEENEDESEEHSG